MLTQGALLVQTGMAAPPAAVTSFCFAAAVNSCLTSTFIFGQPDGAALSLFAMMAFVGLAINVGITTISAPRCNANYHLVSKRAFRESTEELHLIDHRAVWSLWAFAVAGARPMNVPSGGGRLFASVRRSKLREKVTCLCDRNLLQHFDSARFLFARMIPSERKARYLAPRAARARRGPPSPCRGRASPFRRRRLFAPAGSCRPRESPIATWRRVPSRRASAA